MTGITHSQALSLSPTPSSCGGRLLLKASDVCGGGRYLDWFKCEQCGRVVVMHSACVDAANYEVLPRGLATPAPELYESVA